MTPATPGPGAPPPPAPELHEAFPGFGGGPATARPGPLDRLSPRPDGDVAPDALVLRPSLWAALDLLAKVAGAILAIFLPVLLGAWIGGGEVGLATAGAAFTFAEGFNLLYGLLAAVFPMVQLAFTRYVVDEEGLRVRTDLLSRSERRVQWDKVTLLRHRRTLVDRLFGIERLDVVAYGARGTTLHLVGLRGAAALRDDLSRRMRQHASVGGRLGED